MLRARAMSVLVHIDKRIDGWEIMEADSFRLRALYVG